MSRWVRCVCGRRIEWGWGRWQHIGANPKLRCPGRPVPPPPTPSMPCGCPDYSPTSKGDET